MGAWLCAKVFIALSLLTGIWEGHLESSGSEGSGTGAVAGTEGPHGESLSRAKPRRA